MALYSTRYVCETSLFSEEDMALDFEGHCATFSFPLEQRVEHKAHVTVEIEARNWREANLNAQQILQPVIDALAFTTGQPLLLIDWDFILKDELGSETRNALWRKKTVHPFYFSLNTHLVEEAQQVLNSEGGPGIDLCWHRYALQRTLALDRFVFQWLAFESLAGQTEVRRQCEKCGCVHVHMGTDRAEALKILQSAEPGLSEKEFKTGICGKDRNGVFHGSKYPDPKHLRRLSELTPKLRKACEIELSRRYGLASQTRPTGVMEFDVNLLLFLEWQTAKPQNRIALDFPWEAVTAEYSRRRTGEEPDILPIRAPFTTLDLERAASW